MIAHNSPLTLYFCCMSFVGEQLSYACVKRTWNIYHLVAQCFWKVYIWVPVYKNNPLERDSCTVAVVLWLVVASESMWTSVYACLSAHLFASVCVRACVRACVRVCVVLTTNQWLVQKHGLDISSRTVDVLNLAFGLLGHSWATSSGPGSIVWG